MQPGKSAARSKRPFGRRGVNTTGEASAESAPYTRRARVAATVRFGTSVLTGGAVTKCARRLRSEELMSEVARNGGS
jgi:hypothetical protein